MGKVAFAFALLVVLAAGHPADHDHDHDGHGLADVNAVHEDHHEEHHDGVEGDHPHAHIGLGELEGTLLKTHEGKTVAAFLGVPYAKPPVGDLRFKEAVPIEKFESVLKTTKKPPSCMQVSHFGPEKKGLGDWVISHSVESEDCLYLNIYIPHPKPVNASVMVFIHGGGFMVGSSNIDKYDGSELAADEGIIVVTVNYRLSVFGFLYMGEEEAPGNQGLLDMRLALKFVKNHIADFGGNPNQVTLVGEGSGAVAAGLLMLAKSCTCLMQRVFLLNGSPMNVFNIHSKKEATDVSHRLTEKLGCSHPNDHHKVLECLRGKDAKDLIEGSEHLFRDMGMFFPVSDGHLLNHHPRVLAKQGAFNETIPVVLGGSYHRASIVNFFMSPLKPFPESYIDRGDMKNLIKDVLHSKSDFETQAILFHYTNFTHPHNPEALREQSLDLITDAAIICPLNKFADELVYSGNKVFMFHIHNRPSTNKYPEWVGNQNGEDVDFLMGHATPKNGYTELEHQRSHHMMSHLSHFVKHGDPNLSEEDRHWPAYTLRTKTYLDIRVGGTHGHFLRADHCAFWDHAYSRVKHAAALMASHNC